MEMRIIGIVEVVAQEVYIQTVIVIVRVNLLDAVMTTAEFAFGKPLIHLFVQNA